MIRGHFMSIFFGIYENEMECPHCRLKIKIYHETNLLNDKGDTFSYYCSARAKRKIKVLVRSRLLVLVCVVVS